MNYTFPVINHISDVLPSIAGANEFHVNKKDGYTVINYFMTNPNETFPVVCSAMDNYHDAKIRRECRGLIFCNETGKVLSRGYHKFFNQNEREETTNIDLTQPHVILEKLDGSMIRPLFLKGQERPRWITKMGITEVSMQVEEWLVENPELQKKYERYVTAECNLGCTPIFEWCSRKQRIVLDYPEDKLVLTAIRINKTGEYFSFKHTQDTGAKFSIPVVATVSKHFLEQEGVEGIVIRFDDGHMVKVKTDWYVLRHKALDGLRSEKNVLKLMLDDGIDDVMPLLDDKMKEYLGGYVDRVHQNVGNCAAIMEEIFESYKHLDRKQFALKVQQLPNPIWASIYFKMYDGQDCKKAIWDKISKNLSSQSTVDSIRHLIGATWYA